jgi:hypothetical protein
VRVPYINYVLWRTTYLMHTFALAISLPYSQILDYSEKN